MYIQEFSDSLCSQWQILFGSDGLGDLHNLLQAVVNVSGEDWKEATSNASVLSTIGKLDCQYLLPVPLRSLVEHAQKLDRVEWLGLVWMWVIDLFRALAPDAANTNAINDARMYAEKQKLDQGQLGGPLVASGSPPQQPQPQLSGMAQMNSLLDMVKTAVNHPEQTPAVLGQLVQLAETSLSTTAMSEQDKAQLKGSFQCIAQTLGSSLGDILSGGGGGISTGSTTST